MNIKQAFEVYSLVGGGYNKRHLHGYAWTKTEAQQLVDSVSPRRCYTGAVHVIEINGNWHRINVIPVEGLKGQASEAQDSRLITGETLPRPIPSINVQIDEAAPRRIGLDFEYAINMIASHPQDSKCKLYTLRTGGLLPLTFRVRDLQLSSHTQQQVSEWLDHEIKFRLNNQAGAANEAA